jgi:hypothetical protein
MPYRFTATASATEPTGRVIDLYHKLRQGEKLGKAEKEELADRLYGTFGAQGATYKLAGWAYDFSDYLPRFIVRQYDTWRTYYAPNKTSLRKALYGRIEEIYEIPKRN